MEKHFIIKYSFLLSSALLYSLDYGRNFCLVGFKSTAGNYGSIYMLVLMLATKIKDEYIILTSLRQH